MKVTVKCRVNAQDQCCFSKLYSFKFICSVLCLSNMYFLINLYGGLMWDKGCITYN